MVGVSVCVCVQHVFKKAGTIPLCQGQKYWVANNTMPLSWVRVNQFIPEQLAEVSNLNPESLECHPSITPQSTEILEVYPRD